MAKKFKYIFDTFKIINKSERKIVLILFFKNFFSSLSPYIAVYLSSLILNMIIDKRNTDGIIFYSLVGTTLLGLCKLFSVMLTHFVTLSKRRLMFLVEKKVGEKTMDFDYSQLENADIIKSIQKTRENMYQGGDLSIITSHFDNIIKGFFDIVFAVILALPILNNILFLLSPSFIIYLLLVIVLIIINFIAANHLADKRKILTDNLSEIYGIANFYMFGENVGYKNGKDIRIFDLFSLVERDVNTFKNPHSRKLIKQIINNSKITEGNNSLLNGIITIGAFLAVLFFPDSNSYAIGDILKYAAFIAGLFTGILLIFSTFMQLTISCVLLQDTVQFLDTPDALSKGNRRISKSGNHIIEFHNVSFKYENSSVYALKNISLTLKENETYAFVGMNGSGKTTMIKLLCRLYDPTSGFITLDNIDIKEYDYKEYMKFFSVVFQDFKLFSLTLAQNIAVSNIYNEDDVLDSIEKAGFKERYEKMPDGMQSLIYKDMGKEGVEISGGEEQKIAISRALYKNSPFIILDEPTAALDPISEFEIYSRFNELKRNKTAIFISHRLSSCRFCNDIVVFNEGNIVQMGSHDFLIEDKGGKYCELWNAQSQYYN